MTWETRAIVAVRVVLVAAVLIVYGRIVGFGPVNWDDRETIFANAAMRPVSAQTFADAWARPQLSLWIPATHSLWAVLALVGQTGAASGGATVLAVPFRVASLALHAAATLLVFEIVRRLGRRRVAAAALAAAVFAVHPIQVESVAWISGQKDLLAGTLTLAAIVVALRSGERDSRNLRLAAVAIAVVAMLAKPQAIVVAIVLPIVLRLAGISWRDAAWFAKALAVPAAVVAIVAALAQPAPSVPSVAWFWRPFVAMDALAFYARMLIVPMRFAVDYGRTPASVCDVPHAAIALATAMLITGGAWTLRHRTPGVGLGLLIATVAVVPVLGLVPFQFQIYSTVSDHYAYTAMLGIAIVVAAMAERAPRQILVGIGAVATIVLAGLSAAQVGVWRDTNALFAHALHVTPDSLAAHRVLAAEASGRGDDPAAIALLDRVLRDHPGDVAATYNLAHALARLGLLDASKLAFAALIASRPDVASYRHNDAIVLVRLGEFDAAAEQLRAAVAIDPRATASIAALAKLGSMRGAGTTRPSLAAERGSLYD